MALTFLTDQPQKLLDSFNEKIDQKEAKGKITTWKRLSDGVHYTHKADDWLEKAFFKPSVQKDKLVFNIIRPKDSNVTRTVYGYYHGHLTETFLNHFDKLFSSAQASALGTVGDDINAPEK
ncbi:hypothetical protein [Pseudomonas nitroreducens]|uniref:hypothetical protein n=1 Tax=Pseudomonas nitroreducens TaxID=46680 RepID=UPI00265AA493|nr:hypothetical protein [Pseudomonas nitroreducens]MCP1647304.1 hypothetical protein [Pseudomonas nitroreducens]MCP1685880.1 hypothetical protein [Pseudomonas nitroreducens]